MLLVSILLVFCVCGVRNEFSWRCVPDDGSGKANVSVVRAEDGVLGRYIVEFCSPVRAQDTLWTLILSTPPFNPSKCNSSATRRYLSNDNQHSSSKETFHMNETENCSRACFKKPMDLMYRNCYQISNTIGNGMPHNKFEYIDNDISIEYFKQNLLGFKDFSHDSSDLTSFVFYPGNIPITTYNLEICQEPCEGGWVSIHNCSTVREAGAPEGLRCVVRLRRACYALRLRHDTPWQHSAQFDDLITNMGHLCTGASDVTGAPSSGGAAVSAAGGAGAWAGAALLAAAAAALALAIHRTTRLGAVLKRTYANFTFNGNTPSADTSAVMDSACAAIVLVAYAREHHAAPFIQALVELIRYAAPKQSSVLDLHSEETVSLCAEASGRWLGGALRRPDTRVLIVQTDNIDVFVTPGHDTGNMDVPLLGCELAYPEPQQSDTLMQQVVSYALDAAVPEPAPYRKLFLASVEGVSVERLSTVVPFARYSLPGAAALLLRDLVGYSGDLPPGLTGSLRQAAVHLRQHRLTLDTQDAQDFTCTTIVDSTPSSEH